MYYGRLINWVQQNTSTLICQLGTVHICDWLTKFKHIYEPSCLLFHGLNAPKHLIKYASYDSNIQTIRELVVNNILEPQNLERWWYLSRDQTKWWYVRMLDIDARIQAIRDNQHDQWPITSACTANHRLFYAW